MIIKIDGAVVGRVTHLENHLHGEHIWVSFVHFKGKTVQIVFGGKRKLKKDDLVPVAPPGSTVTCLDPQTAAIHKRKMRTRNFRGRRSQGMLCSLDELGWLRGGPDEVAVLRDLPIDYPLDKLPPERMPHVVVDWQRALTIANGLTPAEASSEQAAVTQELSLPPMGPHGY